MVPIISARLAWLMFGLMRAAFLAEIREPPLARIEELIDQVLFDPAVPGQEIGNEQLGKFRLIVNRGDLADFVMAAMTPCSIAVVVEMRSP